MIANSYAKALCSLDIPKEDIYEAKKILDENPELRTVLSNPVIKSAEKDKVADKIFPKSVRNFIKVVCSHQSAEYLDEIFKAYREYYNKKNKILSVQLRYVSFPSEKQLQGIADFLCRKYDMREAEIEMIEDKSLIGGFVLSALGREYDRSIRGRLKDLQRQLNRR